MVFEKLSDCHYRANGSDITKMTAERGSLSGCWIVDGNENHLFQHLWMALKQVGVKFSKPPAEFDTI